jgi:uncharacterized membrane protein YeaQ/YmgE (transglycosylase-associated protein family)
MLMTFTLWILFGALVGWMASLIMKTDEDQGTIANIIIGIVGAFFGGALARLLGGQGASGLNVGSLVVATIGAVLLIIFIRILSSYRNDIDIRQ